MKYTAVKELKCQKKWLLLHPKLSWHVVGGSGVGRVRWWCGTGQLIRIELCGSVQILGLDVGEGDEDSPKICALPHNSFLIHCPAIWLKEVLLDVFNTPWIAARRHNKRKSNPNPNPYPNPTPNPNPNPNSNPDGTLHHV
jgi:hypothetical protein